MKGVVNGLADAFVASFTPTPREGVSEMKIVLVDRESATALIYKNG